MKVLIFSISLSAKKKKNRMNISVSSRVFLGGLRALVRTECVIKIIFSVDFSVLGREIDFPKVGDKAFLMMRAT